MPTALCRKKLSYYFYAINQYMQAPVEQILQGYKRRTV